MPHDASSNLDPNLTRGAIATEASTNKESPDEAVSRRALVTTFLGAIGVAAISGCSDDGDPQRGVDATDTTSLAHVTQALTGSVMQWADTVLGVVPTNPPIPRTGDLATKNSSAIGNAIVVVAKGCVTSGDGGGGLFYWEAGVTTGDDGGTIIVPSSSPTGRWRRIYSGAVDVKWFGASPTSASNDAAVAAAVNVAKSNHSSVFFPAGTYIFASTLQLRNLAGVSFVGDTSLNPGGLVGSTLSFMGTTSPAIDAGYSNGLSFRNLNLRADNSSFNGTLLSFDSSSSTPGSYYTVSDCTLVCPVGKGTLIATDNTFNCTVRNLVFGSCNIAVRGPQVGAFANAWTFTNCVSPNGACTSDVFLNPGLAWSWTGCSFGPLASGAARAIRADSTPVPVRIAAAISINACLFGDDLSADGIWIDGAFEGLSVTGCQFSSKTTTTKAFRFVSPTVGFSARGNSFVHVDCAYDFGSGACANVDCRANVYTTLTTGISLGLPMTGHVDSTASSAVYVGGEEKRFSRLKARVTIGAQSIPSNKTNQTPTQLNNFVVVYDPNSNISTSGIYTCPHTGFYQVNAFIELAMSTGCLEPSLYVQNNRVTYGSRAPSIAGGTAGSSISDIVQLNAGDILDLRVLQNSDLAASVYQGSMSVHYLSS